MQWLNPYSNCSEVRRAAPVIPETLPVIITRTRDTDTLTLKLAYSAVLEPKLGHPRHLTIAQREITKAGLGDCEAVVRAASAKMIMKWLDIAMSKEPDPSSAPKSWEGEDGGVMKGFTNFLAFFDVIGPGECFLLLDAFVFGVYNALLSLMQEIDFLDAGEPDYKEREAREEELILGELLRIAVKLDYMDEIGRRKVFSVFTDMLAHPHFPPGLIERCLDVLCKILPSKRELIRIVVEIIIELRDDDTEQALEDDNFDASRSDVTFASSKKDRSIRRTKEYQDMTAEEQHEADLNDMRCLVLCIGMLERVNGTFEDNSMLEGVLTDLIVPAVKRKELALREKGLVALGLCCLTAWNMTTNSFQLFLNQVQMAPEELKLKSFLGGRRRFHRNPHANVALDILLALYDSERSDDVRKVFCKFLGQLRLFSSNDNGLELDNRIVLKLDILVENLQEIPDRIEEEGEEEVEEYESFGFA
ncbi:hypothetical protein BT96DRAFT_938756 [Gymnopus androsaceus JB14]|uniref:Nuclear condensin complex subunit 3 C-terminal domain-containing protein n=1 Tax=Gymnopus androsaceus JB14 TaxID=1447944 RepID=A0A6A4HQK3_9AGAR|nr:hypothetical protein BT96DRAFT_938756 [Gymnopus androsaceus JB14]